MQTCPFCSASLTETDVPPERCPACGRELELDRDAPTEPLEPPAAGQGGEQVQTAPVETEKRSDDEADTVNDQAIEQTIDFSKLPGHEDEDAPRGTADAGIDLSAPDDDPSKTIDGPRHDKTIEQGPQNAGPKKPGTVYGPGIEQTLEFSGQEEAPTKPPTIHGPGIDRTIEYSDEAPPKKPGTVADRGSAATLDSGEFGGTGTSRLSMLWGKGLTRNVHAASTIRADAGMTDFGSALVIPPRRFRDGEEESGERIDYDLLQLLGEGGMGQVFAARQASMDRTVAVKMLRGDVGVDEGQRNKFLSEAVVTGDLEHPNIVPVYELGMNDRGELFYSMKRVQGTPWDEVIRAKSLPENIEILMKVADAVAFAHSREVIHRDLKPENIMLGGFGEVLVMDWGLAMPVGDRAAGIDTRLHRMGGTPAYMAPEMATGPMEKIGIHSDIYLLGAILYEIITHTPPHKAKDALACLAIAAKNQIEPTDKSGELLNIALRAMATEPVDRYATVGDFQEAIRDYLSHSESIALSTRAAKDLEQARETDVYQDYARAVFAFQDAFELWEGNAQAREGLTEGRLAYAQSALRKGDFDLALSLLEEDKPEHARLAEEVREAQRERDARQHRLVAAKRAAGGLGIAVVVIFVVAFVWILAAMSEAQRQRDNARVAQAEAEDRRQEAESARKQAEERRLEAERAREQEEEARLAEVDARKKAVSAQEKAEEERKIAEAERMKAEQARLAADEARDAAEEAKEKEEYEAYIARIGLAAAKIDDNAFERARQLLAACKPELRNWEWGRLVHVCSQSVHDYSGPSPLNSVAFSPDGRRFVVGNWDGEAQVWDTGTGEPVLKIDDGGSFVHAVAYSPGGDLIATASNDRPGFVKLWNAKTGQLVRKLEGHSDAALSVGFSRDGKWLLTTSFDKTARLWDVETGRELRTYIGHTWWVWDAAFSPDGTRIVTCSQDGTAIIWDTSTGERKPPFPGHRGPVYSADFSPDGQHVVTGGYDTRVLVWDPDEVRPFPYGRLVSGEEVPPPEYEALEGHAAAVRCVKFSPDGSRVASSGYDNTVRVWDVETGDAIKTLRGHDSWVRSCAFSPDGQRILSASYDNQAKLWSVEGYEESRVLRGRLLSGHADAILGASFSDDGRRVVTASRDRTAKTWAVEEGRELVSFEEGHGYLASAAEFFPDGKRLVSAAVDNTARVWDVASGTEMFRLDRTGRGAAVAVSPDGRWILTGSDSRSAKLWDARTGELVRVLEGHRADVTAVAFSPDGEVIYTGDAAGEGRLWTAAGKKLHDLGAHTRRISAAAFLGGGERLLTASADKTVANWDVASGREDTERILKHPDSVTSLAVTADGRYAVTSCEDGAARVWDVAQVELVQQLKPADGMVDAVALAPGSETLLTVDAGARTVRLWDLSSGREIEYPAGQDRVGPFVDLSARGGLLWSAAFSPDGRSVVAVGGDSARLFDIDEGREMMTFSPHGVIASARFSPSGDRVVTASWDNSARIWDADTGKDLLKLGREHAGPKGPHAGNVNSAVFSPDADGRWVLTASDDETARLWDSRTGEVVRAFEGHTDRVHYATFTPDGRHVVTTSSDKTARLWDAETGETLGVFEGHEWPVLHAAVSSDGTLLVTGSADNTARIWDVDSRETLHTLLGHTASVTAVAFSPDASRVLTASDDQTAKLWDARTEKEILTLRGHTQELTSAAFAPDGQTALTASRDGTAILWLAVPWGQGDGQSP